jgi:hypothetical protein
MTPEAAVTREILLGTRHLCDWMRNNSGVADQHGRTVRYGCGGNGCADYLGVLRSSGRFVAMEIKSTNGRVSDDQTRFLARVRRSGGIAFVARCLQDALDALHG